MSFAAAENSPRRNWTTAADKYVSLSVVEPEGRKRTNSQDERTYANILQYNDFLCKEDKNYRMNITPPTPSHSLRSY